MLFFFLIDWYGLNLQKQISCIWSHLLEWGFLMLPILHLMKVLVTRSQACFFYIFFSYSKILLFLVMHVVFQREREREHCSRSIF